MKNNQVKRIEMWPQKATKAGCKMLVACSRPAQPRTALKPALEVLESSLAQMGLYTTRKPSNLT